MSMSLNIYTLTFKMIKTENRLLYTSYFKMKDKSDELKLVNSELRFYYII